MMNKLMVLMGLAGTKEVEYRYVFTPPECGGVAGAVCVG